MQKELTAQQVETLARFEQNFGTALRGGWSSPLGTSAVDILARTWEEVSGQRQQSRANCSFCVLTLLRDLGNMYLRATGKTLEDLAPSRTTVLRPAAPMKDVTPAKASKTTAAPRKSVKSKKSSK